jgi:hypothetical protein
MSEYQYYEFQAIDRALSADQVDKLRSYSTRAQITSTTFTNEYYFHKPQTSSSTFASLPVPPAAPTLDCDSKSSGGCIPASGHSWTC